MAWLEAAAAAVSAAELASKAAGQSADFKRGIDRIVYWLKNRKTILPVFGAGGVGKSTIGESILSGAKMVAEPYQASNITENFDLKGSVPARIVAVPGQPGRVGGAWPDQYKAIIKGEAIGILNVVAYGYHSIGIDHLSQHKLFQAGDTVDQFMARYVAEKRNEEISRLRDLLAALPANDNPIWMYTVINKQDLWFHELADVKSHYEDGEYGSLISDFTAQQGARSFNHDFIPASLTMQNLLTNSGEMLKATAEGYDMARHTVSVSFLLNSIGDSLSAGKR